MRPPPMTATRHGGGGAGSSGITQARWIRPAPETDIRYLHCGPHSSRTTGTHPERLCITRLLASNAQPWFDTSAVCTNIHNFQADSGLVFGLGMAFKGLGASVDASLYSGYFQPRVRPFILLLALLQLGVPCAVGVVLRRVSDAQRAV